MAERFSLLRPRFGFSRRSNGIGGVLPGKWPVEIREIFFRYHVFERWISRIHIRPSFIPGGKRAAGVRPERLTSRSLFLRTGRSRIAGPSHIVPSRAAVLIRGKEARLDNPSLE